MQKFFFPAAASVAVLVIIAPLLAQAPAPATPAPAQTPPPTQTPARAPAPRPRATPPTQVIVRTNSGNAVEGVRVTVSGGTGTQAETDAKGMSAVTLPAGSYRFRFEHEGFITLERDVTVRAGQPTEVAVALDMAFTPPPPPPAPEPPPPPAAPKPVAGGPPTNMSIPQFLEKNYIGRDPLKESVVGCTATATTRILQLRDSLASHTHDDLDETLYVVAGEGVIRVKNQMMMITPGSLTVIPRGQPHSTERSGRNPLILLSTLSGAPCQTAANRP
jgi:mannose-6-phosphate isomerase-like protein (cupin superfamily)